MTNVPPGEDPTRGHSHPTIEELYYVVDGQVTVKAGDDVETLGPRDAVLIPKGVVHMARNEGDGPAVLAMVSARLEDPRGASEWHDDFWPTS
jgi:mannose-6-phosphate isomerase-like protein (cupin superfamily)